MRSTYACLACSALLAACTLPLMASAHAVTGPDATAAVTAVLFGGRTAPNPVPEAFGAVEAGQYSASSAPRMSMKEFKALLDAGGVVVLDVRSLEAYRAGHIPGAISVPLETVAARAAEFKAAGKPVTTYCA